MPPVSRRRRRGPSRRRSGGPDDDLVAIGADLEPGTLLAAYRAGLFPMPFDGDRRAVAGGARSTAGCCRSTGCGVSRSLRRSARGSRSASTPPSTRWSPRAPTPAAPAAGSTTTSGRRTSACTSSAGCTPSRRGATARLAGGLYGVAIGGLFAGESMFHRERDASKVALLGLVDLLSDEYAGQRLVDVQWRTPHLASLGVVEVPRADYLSRLRARWPCPSRQPGAEGDRPGHPADASTSARNWSVIRPCPSRPRSVATGSSPSKWLTSISRSGGHEVAGIAGMPQTGVVETCRVRVRRQLDVTSHRSPRSRPPRRKRVGPGPVPGRLGSESRSFGGHHCRSRGE